MTDVSEIHIPYFSVYHGMYEDLKHAIMDIEDKYGDVRVIDICDLLGIASKYSDSKYGWKKNNIRISIEPDPFKLDSVIVHISPKPILLEKEN